jgi:hypothetical protein
MALTSIVGLLVQSLALALAAGGSPSAPASRSCCPCVDHSGAVGGAPVWTALDRSDRVGPGDEIAASEENDLEDDFALPASECSLTVSHLSTPIVAERFTAASRPDTEPGTARSPPSI